MVLLVVAHPDDEVLWFDPTKADKILIVFSGRKDRPWFDEARRNALKDHPLKGKIELLGLTESNFWRDETQTADYKTNARELEEHLSTLTPTLVYTHAKNGEYEHSDHILVHKAVKKVFDCGIKYSGDFNEELHDKVKKIYKSHNVWTWTD